MKIKSIFRSKKRILTDLADDVSFHYFNCLGECDKFRVSMAKLAEACGFETDPYTQKEIREILETDAIKLKELAARVQSGENWKIKT